MYTSLRAEWATLCKQSFAYLQLVFLILIHWIVIYPVDSSIQRLNNWGLVKSTKFIVLEKNERLTHDHRQHCL